MPFDVADGCAACGRQTRWMQHHLTSAVFFIPCLCFAWFHVFGCDVLYVRVFALISMCIYGAVCFYTLFYVSVMFLFWRRTLRTIDRWAPDAAKHLENFVAQCPKFNSKTFIHLHRIYWSLLESRFRWGGGGGWTLIDRRVLRKKTSAESGLSPIVFELQYLYRYTHSFICDCNERQAPKKWIAAAVSAHPCVYLPRQSRIPGRWKVSHKLCPSAKRQSYN